MALVQVEALGHVGCEPPAGCAIHPHPRIEYGAGSSLPPSGGKGLLWPAGWLRAPLTILRPVLPSPEVGWTKYMLPWESPAAPWHVWEVCNPNVAGCRLPF